MGDVSDRDEESLVEDVETIVDTIEIRFLMPILRANSRQKIEVPTYEGSLNAKEIVDWVRAMDKYLDL